LHAANIYMQPADDGESPATIQEFTAALRERKTATGLYSENVGGVQFLSQNLFRATVRLAPNVPVGTHKARAFLFK
ncbi:MAG: TIGR02186 family protein, partial [Mesorhizobium sp.]